MKNMKRIKALRDLKSNPGKTALVLFALCLGLWGVGTILVSWTVLSRDLRTNFLKTSPAQVILTSTDFKLLNLAEFKKRPDIESAEFRDLVFQRVEVHPGEWIPLWLFGVEDFERSALAHLASQQGARTPPPGSMVIERNGKLISDLRIGSTANVRAGTRKLTIPISGIVFDPAMAPATQDHFIYAYTDQKTWAQISGTPSGERLIFRVKEAKSLDDVEQVNEKIVEAFRQSGIRVSSSVVPKFNEHPHQWQLSTLLFLIGSIGLLAFLMAAVLVSQLMNALMARQVRQIGILKAIGGSRLRIFKIYFLMLLFFGIVSSLVAIPLAIASGYGFSFFVAKVLNFEVLTRTLPWTVYASLIAAGILLPILFSLPSIRRGLGRPVRESLSDEGIGALQSISNTSAVRWPLPPGILMSFRNTFRRKGRLALTVLAMGLGAAIFLTGFNVRKSLWQFLTDLKTGMRHDVQVVLNVSLPRSEALAVFEGVPGLERVELWNGGRGELQSQKISTLSGIGIVAIPEGSTLLNLPLVSGRWLSPSEDLEIVMNQQALTEYHHPTVGSLQPIAIGGTTRVARLVGVVEEFEKPKVYLTQTHYDAWVNPEHRINSLMFVAKDKRYEAVIALKKEIEKRIEGSALDVLYVMSQAERVKIIYDHLNIILSTILLLAFLVLLVSGLGMASATGINIMERTREIGVLRAVGATPTRIYNLFVGEGMVIVTASLALGLALAWPLSFAAAIFFGRLMLGDEASLRISLSQAGLWVTIFATFLFGYLASRVPASQAVKVETWKALSYE